MSIDPALLRALQAAGGTTDMVIAMVEADHALEEEKRARKRVGNAARQRKHKANKKVRANGSNALPASSAVTERDRPPLNDNILIPPVPPLHVRTEHSGEEAADAPPTLLPEHVLEAWNAMADRLGLPKAKLTADRKRKLAARIRQHSIDDFTEAISAVERSPFLRGENDRGWRADFDFLLQPSSFTKLIEGSYDRPN